MSDQLDELVANAGTGQGNQRLSYGRDVDELPWYVFGDVVVDRLLGVHRASAASVFFNQSPPSRSRVTEVLGMDTLPLRLSDQAPSVITNLDGFVLTPERTLVDIHGDPATLPPSVYAIEVEIGVPDLIRLCHLHKQYPEISWEERLWTRVKSGFDHLLSFVDSSPDLKLMLIDFDL